MDVNTYELLDTIVKIGLAAIIGAYSSYKITKLKYKSDITKERLIRQVTTLEKITELAENYFQTWSKYTSAIDGVTKKTVEENIEVSEKQWKWIHEQDLEFVETRKSKSSAISRLRLLGKVEIAKALGHSGGIENELRTIVIFEERIPTLKELLGFQKKMRKSKTFFYEQLSSYYNGLI